MKEYIDKEWFYTELETLRAELNELKNSKATLMQCYPIGSIYTSTDTTNPQTLLGFGTWEKIKDRFLLASGSTYSSGATGGSATHILTSTEMPSHKHSVTVNSAGSHQHTLGVDHDVAYVSGGKCASVHKDGIDPSYWQGATNNTGAHTHTTTVGNTGSGAAHNNMPPYLVVNIWRRVA